MTDRELLELAAKAAGIEYDKAASFPPDGKTYSFFGLWLVIEVEPNERTRRRWNPLTDDGDALRLAVKLGMTISLIPPYENDSYCSVVADWSDETGYPRTNISIRHAGDPLAATRRAIVRAAAELVKREAP